MTSTSPPDTGADDFETIAPADVSLAAAGPGTEPTPAVPSAPAGPPALLLWGGGLTLAVLAAVVIFLLPAAVEERRTAPDTAPRVTAPGGAEDAAVPAGQPTRAEATPEVAAPFESLRAERERRAAQEILERMLELTEFLETRAVERWGAEAMAAARGLAEQGDADFLAQDYETAQARYAESVAALEALDERREALRAERSEAGFTALDAGDAATASEAFAFVLDLAPDDADARRGAARAAVTDEVLALLEDARQVAEDGAVDAARNLVTQALDLDGDNRDARTLAAELDARLARGAFLDEMSAGYAALRARRFDEAEAAFARAEALEADAPEIAEGRRFLAAERFAARIEALRAEGEAAEAESRWADAVTAYATAVELDGTLAFARTGLARSRERADIDAGIIAVVTRPEELNQPGQLEAARALLDRARAADAPDARLTGQIDRFEETLRLAVIPVSVAFASDGFTQVRILREGELGRFTSTERTLLPGRYVATGARIGYRDVRIEFVVTPTGTGAPVEVRCTARI